MNLCDGIQIYLPDSLDKITPYVLEEQFDWFEDEIKFIRKLIEHGQNVIDIGANYGLYTLNMANNVGPQGHVYAFEPATDTASILQMSIKLNNFKNVTTNQKALSHHEGEMYLTKNEQSELNALVSESPTDELVEKVLVTSLDNFIDQINLTRIDFVKVDAEGAENDIIDGGLRFLKSQSPIIQYEINDGRSFKYDLVNKFKTLGYDSYRLIPSLNLLVPFEETDPPNHYLLNLFCFKKETATSLSNRGLLILNKNPPIEYVANLNLKLERMNSNNIYFNNFLIELPYFKFLKSCWKGKRESFDTDLIKALNIYSIAKTSEIKVEKYYALTLVFLILTELCKKSAVNLRLSTLARVALELGYRTTAIEALKLLTTHINETKTASFVEPFLFAQSQFDSINLPDFKIDLTNFFLGTVLHTLEMKEYFSSFFSGRGQLNRLYEIKQLGISDFEIDRRISLIERRYSLD